MFSSVSTLFVPSSFFSYQVDIIVVECSHMNSLVRSSRTVSVCSSFVLLCTSLFLLFSEGDSSLFLKGIIAFSVFSQVSVTIFSFFLVLTLSTLACMEYISHTSGFHSHSLIKLGGVTCFSSHQIPFINFTQYFTLCRNIAHVAVFY